MISEYLRDHYSNFHCIVKVPLGALPPKLLAIEGTERTRKLIRPFRPEIDAVVVLPRHLLLIEAKVWNVVDGIAKLPFYKELVPFTPELQQYLPRELIMNVVVGWKNPNHEIMASSHDIKIKIYCPEWLQQVRDDMHKYWTKEYRQAREEKLAMQQYFGVD